MSTPRQGRSDETSPSRRETEARATGLGEGAPGSTAAQAVSPEALLPSEEQLLYAKILAWGTYTGLVILVVTFTLYILGTLTPSLPIQELPNYWTLSAHEYLEAVNQQFLHREHLVTGWRWVAVLNRGDYLNFVGIAFLALVTIVCYASIVPTLLRKRDWIYSGIALMEILILVLAASGILKVGH
jgi:hypothetical protein